MNVEVVEEKGEYNPYQHRKVEKPNSDIRSAANLIKSSLGSGLLAGPLAFSNAGWGVGIFGTLLVGVICGHCIHILVTEEIGRTHILFQDRSSRFAELTYLLKGDKGIISRNGQELLSASNKNQASYQNKKNSGFSPRWPTAAWWSTHTIKYFMENSQVRTSQRCCVLEKKPSLGYAETCRSAFMNGPKGMRKFANAASIFAEFALLCTYAGVCCIYTVLISDSVKQLVDRYAPSTILPVEYYCLIILVPIILLCQIKYLKFLAIFSGIANILLVTVYIVCLYYIFGSGNISLAGKHAAGDPARYPAFLSTVIFAMEGVGVVMPIENTMKKPQNFLGCPSVLVVAMSAIVFLYGTLGMFGYLRYGDVLRGSITLNLPTDEWPAILAKVSIALSIFLTYPLQFYVVIDIFTRYTQAHIKENYQQVTQILARTIGVCCCVGIGMALPMLEQILNIVGALFYSILGLIIPSVVETVFRWENLGKWNWILWKNTFIICFGLLCLVSGCTVTIMDIIEILHRKIE